MNNDIQDYICRANQTAWQPLIEDGVNTSGIFTRVLRFDERSGRAPTILLKFEPGASYPNHNHPGGEELFVLEGEVTVGDDTLTAGDYLYAPRNSRHRVSSENGCVVLAVIPEEVELVDE